MHFFDKHAAAHARSGPLFLLTGGYLVPWPLSVSVHLGLSVSDHVRFGYVTEMN